MSTIPASTTTSHSTTSNDLMSLDFTSFGTESTAASDVNNQGENWANFKSDSKANSFDPFGPSVTMDRPRSHSPSLSPFVSSNPFLSGQASSGFSKTTSPSKAPPHRLSPEKLNPFKVAQDGTRPFKGQQTFPSHTGQINNFSKPSINTRTSPLHKNNSNQCLPVKTNPFLSPQHRSVSTLNKSSSLRQPQANKDSELFSDLLGSWKTREGL